MNSTALREQSKMLENIALAIENDEITLENILVLKDVLKKVGHYYKVN